MPLRQAILSRVKQTPNPVRYSLPFVLLLTFCLYSTQHYDPAVLHKGFDPNILIEEAQGNLIRQLAFLALGVVGLLGIQHYRSSAAPKLVWDRRMLLPMLLLLGWCFLSLFWSDISMVAARRLLVVGLMLLGGFGLALSWTHLQILRFIALSSSIYLTIGVQAEISAGYMKLTSGDYRFAGTLTANEQGYLCMALVLSAVCALWVAGQSRAWTLLYRALAVYGFIFLLLTRSRGALAALGIACLLYFLIVMSLKKRLLAGLLIGTGILASLLSGIGPAIVDTLNRGGEGSANFTGRGPLWTELMEYVSLHPLLGVGFESFWTAATIDDIFKHQHWPINSAHSEYIESMLTIGIIGMVLHTLVLLAGTAEGIRLFRRTNEVTYFMAASLCCIYLAGGFLEVLLITKPSIVGFYLILLLCLVMVSGASVKDTTPMRVAAATERRPPRRSSVLASTPVPDMAVTRGGRNPSRRIVPM